MPADNEKSYCIAFLCDEGYLFPTLVCAKQARAQAPADTDIVILLDAPALDEERRARLEAISGASLRLIPAWLPRIIDERVPEGFFQTHVSKAALFRMFVAQLLDKRYDQIIYLDGDIQIRQPLAPLFDIAPPEGLVAGVPDWLALHSVDGMPHVEQSRAYLSGLGLGPSQWGSYINTGMMMASPDTWNSIGPQALDFLVANPGACRLHDQSALNSVCRDRISPISVRWNYLRQYMALPAYRAIDPAVVHFVGRLKPWDGVYPPWGRAEFAPYVEMARALKGDGVVWRRQPLIRRLAYHLRPLFKKDEYADPAYRAKIDRALRDHA